VGELLTVDGKAHDFATTKLFIGVICTDFSSGLNSQARLFTGFIRDLFHGRKSLISSVNFLFIPIFHTTYNNERQYKLTYY
jgi:nitrate/nitrite transporter NarK